MTAPAIAAIVLCAGQSQRMGRPKALLVWQGRTFLAHVLERAKAHHLAPIVAIEGATSLQHQVQVLGFDCVHHAGWANGPLSSLIAGLNWLSERSFAGTGVVLFSVDRPRIADTTLACLLAHIRAQPRQIWQPLYNGTRAHPLYLPQWCWPAIRAHSPQGTLRELLNNPAWQTQRATFVCDDPAVLENFDTPADLAAAGIAVDKNE